jgi:hypothetical protein
MPEMDFYKTLKFYECFERELANLIHLKVEIDRDLQFYRETYKKVWDIFRAKFLAIPKDLTVTKYQEFILPVNTFSTLKPVTASLSIDLKRTNTIWKTINGYHIVQCFAMCF